MTDQMAGQLPSDGLSASLQAVLSSLNVNLEAELNRYRRNRVLGSAATDDLFADLEDPSFDLETVESSISVPAVAVPTPPPLPPNKKLTASLTKSVSSTSVTSADAPSADSLAKSPSQHHTQPPASNADPSASYLASSEKLIESLKDVPEMPDPVDTVLKPKRKTLSLLAGATLGLFGLVAGLGASYIMSNPLVAQRLARGFKKDDGAIATAAKDRFDPPGPDLSEQEFVDIDIDNLSSLKMPRTTIDPALQPDLPSVAPLPPIASAPAPLAPLPAATQAVAIPAGVNYYVTVPFTTEQGLLNVRQTVDEAFVRQFSDGNRIQLAAFDNPEDAQQFLSEVASQGVTAQVYGPTTE